MLKYLYLDYIERCPSELVSYAANVTDFPDDLDEVDVSDVRRVRRGDFTLTEQEEESEVEQEGGIAREVDREVVKRLVKAWRLAGL